ncbi:glycosyl transferase family 1 protein [Coccomyxa subellipsoidea C-169]|uniref:Alpha-1,3/1,6-mannosyltransferase ALG2 n=1 Tax=Coccomyxa subellipsoidea (strain C-169) TaxID=574566 RepID=I0Z7E9_COCSC|nr:glycosyl transferase family 1 protein [Coccomyxa subellipsoidea C-169]EIE26568.1 glycosyl transferase family 1 protein [Coccomyxa subellipsoidea C-169]|eukprot:XP_005651112.1 glycosyl transferase family 1 protein [Coccomyxa subellipsoidea C-169]
MADVPCEQNRLAIAFCHPDLGLGGAERLVVDAACELASHGNSVDVFTAHHDRNRCFSETVGGPFSVTVSGSWFPRSIVNRLHAFCAYVRCILIAAYIAWTAFRQYDVVFVDQVSAAVPVLRLLTSSKVLFYCHFPDQLLAKRRSRLHSIYRTVLDAVEESTTGQAHQLLVNRVFLETFGRLKKRGLVPSVFYPALSLDPDLVHFLNGKHVFLSINRFERKKSLGLAVRAFGALQGKCAEQAEVSHSVLVLAGGFDKRLAENREHFCELQELVQQLGLQDKVRLVASFSDAQRSALLAVACAVLYTPENEHFGIVPLEAMAAGRPVVACDSGGPKETVVNGITGHLCPPQATAFAAAMARLADPDTSAEMGKQARLHVQKTFSRTAFGNKLNGVVQRLAKT